MFNKSKVFLMLMVFVLAMFLVGCGVTDPGEPSAKVVITSVSGYLWQTKEDGVELLPNRGCGYPYTVLTMIASPDKGTISLGTGCYELVAKPSINISATADSGWEFDFWTTTKSGTISNLMDVSTILTVGDTYYSDILITAHFKEIVVPLPGCTPEIIDGTWWICGVDTHVPATGDDGENGCTPEIIDGFWWICDESTGIPATGEPGTPGDDGLPGEDGCTPEIGANGNWYICDIDTGIPATGQTGAAGTDGVDGTDGTDGTDGNTPYIQDGTWWIDGVDTGIPVTGDQGETGDQGGTGQTGATGPQGPAGQDLTLPDSIYVYYTITNIGSVNIQEYTITFEAETNGGVYTGIAIGEDLPAGTTVYSYVKIDVFSKEVTFIDYSLELK